MKKHYKKTILLLLINLKWMIKKIILEKKVIQFKMMCGNYNNK